MRNFRCLATRLSSAGVQIRLFQNPVYPSSAVTVDLLQELLVAAVAVPLAGSFRCSDARRLPAAAGVLHASAAAGRDA